MNNAYVTLMYGDNDYFLGTLIFIISLKKTKPKYDTVLLYTFDVPNFKLNILKEYFDVLIQVDYLRLRNKVTKRKRFKDIFTKLRIFTLTEYDNILFLDTDMYVLKNIDDIFSKYNAPAGLVIGDNLSYKNKEKVLKKREIINAGTLLLKPSLKDLNKMNEDLKDFDISQELEQEFLSYFYENRWTNMSYLYNYQFGLQILDTDSKRTIAYKNTLFEDIYIIHYSSNKKPWDYVLKNISLKGTWLQKFEKYYCPWFKLFMKTYKDYAKLNIDLFDLQKQYFDIYEYIQKYKNLKLLKLNTKQIDRLNEKLKNIIPKSNLNHNEKDFTYKSIINQIKKSCNLFIIGGIPRNLINNSELNDIDMMYTCKPEKFISILKSIKSLNFIRGKNNLYYFRIGPIENFNIDFFHISHIDDVKNSTSNSLLLDVNNNIIIDIYGDGIIESKNKIFRKPKHITYKEWNEKKRDLLARLIKFILMGYKTNKTDRKMIYNDWYFKRTKEDYKQIKKKIFDSSFNYIILEIIKNDINNLKLKFTGKDMINKIKKMIDLY